MTTKNNLTSETFYSPLLVKRVLIGAVVALVLIILFISGAKTQPGWPELWRIRPLIITPLAGAAGALFFHFMARLGQQGGWIRLVTILIGILGYIVALWLGTVLGLDGTLWD